MIEDCAYRRLLDHYYATEQQLPKEIRKLHNICRATTAAEKKAVETVVSSFFAETESGYSNRRCDEVIAAYRELTERNRENGHRGGRPVGSRKKKPSGFFLGSPVGSQTVSQVVSETEPKPNPEKRQPETINHKPEENTNTPLTPLGGDAASPRGFVPPTVPEVAAYCGERKNFVDPQVFVDFYTSKGWMVGRNRMRDWKSAVRTWEKSDGRNSAVGAGVVAVRGGVPSREQQREERQLDTIAKWLDEQTAGVQPGEVCQSNGSPVCLEAHG